MKRRRVVITGVGIFAPNGNGTEEFSTALESGRSGIGSISSFDPLDLKTKIAAEIKNFDATDYMSVATARKTDRFSQLGVAASRAALEDASLYGNEDVLQCAAVIIGSGLGGLLFHEDVIFSVISQMSTRKVAASSVPRITPNAVSAYIALENKIKGPNQVISTACSSSAQAIGEAFRKVAFGEVSLALTGGVDAPVSLVNMSMYQAMYVLGTPRNGDVADASRPFDKTRSGFVMGEGAGCIVLEELEHAKARGAKIYAELVGYGSNCGAYHMVSPNPSGEDARDAMQRALDDAGAKPEEVDYVSAHGTSTKLNDLAETRAIKALLGQRAKDVPVSGIKSMVGHTIGASGAIQLISCCLAFEREFLPPTINLKEPDPECDLDYVANKSRKKKVNFALSNSFGFGSNNAVLALRRY